MRARRWLRRWATTKEREIVSREASASIRGYFAQVVRTALEWVRLGPEECLVVEGNENADRQYFEHGRLVAVELHQHKTTAGRVSWTKDTKRSVLGFAVAFAKFDRQGVRCTPLYVATSPLGDSDVLLDWQSLPSKPEKATSVVERVANDLRGHPDLGGNGRFAKEASAAIAYLDADRARWERFVISVRFETTAPSWDEDLRALTSAVAQNPYAKGLSAEVAAKYILEGVFRAAIQADIELRELRAESLVAVLQDQRSDIEKWAATDDAKSWLSQLDLADLIGMSSREIRLESSRGAVDQRGGPRAPRRAAETAMAESSSAPLRVVIGERGAGKTSFVASWLAERITERPIVWLRCRTDAVSFGAFLKEQGLRRPSDLLKTMRELDALLVLDALDQGRTAEASKTLAEFVEHAMLEKVQTVAIVRTRHAETEPDIERLLKSATVVTLPPLEDYELNLLLANPGTPKALVRLREEATPTLHAMMRLPLHLHLLWRLAERHADLDIQHVGTIAKLLMEYWKNVVLADREPTNGQGMLDEIVDRMLQAKALTAVAPESPVVSQLVRAEVLVHPRVAGFGIDETRVSFAFDALFDFAVFRCAWMRLDTTQGLADSIQGCGAFVAALDKSFQYLLDYLDATKGAQAAVDLARVLFAREDVNEGVRAMVAMEVAKWVARKPARASALIARFDAAGAQLLFERVGAVQLGHAHV